MVRSLSLKLTGPELDLVCAMRELGFGEMFGVEIPDAEQETRLMIPQATYDLILHIRSGVRYIDVLTVHRGQPTLAETDLKIDTFRCRKKVKFPTG